jgi:hypothetical protein
MRTSDRIKGRFDKAVETGLNSGAVVTATLARRVSAAARVILSGTPFTPLFSRYPNRHRIIDTSWMRTSDGIKGRFDKAVETGLNSGAVVTATLARRVSAAARVILSGKAIYTCEISSRFSLD